MLLIRISSSLRLTLTLILALVLLASGAAAPAAAQTTEQDSEQDAESGEIGQSGKVLNSGDNSNQCVALQPVANTGNAETEVDVIVESPAGHQYTKRFDLKDLADELDLDLEDIGSSIEIDPEQRTDCNQQVNQSAAAASEESPGHCTWSWDNGWWCKWSTDGSWWFQDYSGSWTAYDAGYWSWDGYYWWWSDGYTWWWTDGYYWYPWGLYNTVSNVAEGALNGSGSLATLGVLATLGLAGTGLVIRRNRSGGSEG